MQNRTATMHWQVTCQCGWRTHGTKEEIIPAVQMHGRSAHTLEITEDQVMALAVPAGGA
jgi:predicted small metal-binding protein